MRRLIVTSVVLSLAASVTGCGKASTQDQSAAPPPPPSLAAMKALQAALPAPYNTANLENGQAKFALCASCHTITPGGPNMTGPHLHDVVGRKAGSIADYNYSEALKSSGWIWDAARLDAWLTNPRTMLAGTKMSFVGLRDPKDRTDLIAYLMVNSPPKPH
jgi:cytochrome c